MGVNLTRESRLDINSLKQSEYILEEENLKKYSHIRVKFDENRENEVNMQKIIYENLYKT